MFKVTRLNTNGLNKAASRPAQFGLKLPEPTPDKITPPPKPADLLAALDEDLFVRQAPSPEISPQRENPALEALEQRYGDLQPSTLMVLDEMQHLLSRLNLEDGRQVKLSAVKTPGRALEEHILLDAAHDGIYDRLLKGLHDLGAVRSGLEAHNPDNHLQYAGVSVLLFERGLEEDQLPEAILQAKTARENLGRGDSAQQAAALLSDRLQEQGFKGIQVHSLALTPPAQLWALYPVTGTLSRDLAQEQALQAALEQLPESEPIEGQPGFRHDQQHYPVILSPNLVKTEVLSQAPSHKSMSEKVQHWFENWRLNLQALLRRFQPAWLQTAEPGDRFTFHNPH